MPRNYSSRYGRLETASCFHLQSTVSNGSLLFKYSVQQGRPLQYVMSLSCYGETGSRVGVELLYEVGLRGIRAHEFGNYIACWESELDRKTASLIVNTSESLFQGPNPGGHDHRIYQLVPAGENTLPPDVVCYWRVERPPCLRERYLELDCNLVE